MDHFSVAGVDQFTIVANTLVLRGKVQEVSAMLKAIHAKENKGAAMQKGQQIIKRFYEMKLPKAAVLLEDHLLETLSYYDFPPTHQRYIRTNNPLERIMKEIRRRTRVVGAFPDGHSALMLCAARLRHIAGTRWGLKKYLDMNLLKNISQEMKEAC